MTGAAATAGLMASPGRVRAAGTGILLINPNTNKATTDMMVQIARSAAPNDIEIVGATAPHGPAMIIEPEALAASAPQVVELGLALGKDVSGIIISAFGDPGWADLRRQVSVPVVGIAEAAMLAASDKGRRFGVATTTPMLIASIDARAAELGLAKLYTGTRVTTEDPNKLVADPGRLVEALRRRRRHLHRARQGRGRDHRRRPARQCGDRPDPDVQHPGDRADPGSGASDAGVGAEIAAACDRVIGRLPAAALRAQFAPAFAQPPSSRCPNS